MSWIVKPTLNYLDNVIQMSYSAWSKLPIFVGNVNTHHVVFSFSCESSISLSQRMSYGLQQPLLVQYPENVYKPAPTNSLDSCQADASVKPLPGKLTGRTAGMTKIAHHVTIFIVFAGGYFEHYCINETSG